MKWNRGGGLTLLASRILPVATVLLCVFTADGQRDRPPRVGSSRARRADPNRGNIKAWNWYTVQSTLKVQGIHVGESGSPCYRGLGCFRLKDNMRISIGGPQSPEEVGTRFFFFSRETPWGRQVSIDNWEEMATKNSVNLRRRLIAIIHGYISSGREPWALAMRDALLKHVDCNVIMVDWKKGAAGNSYHRAARNSPMPGVQLSLLLRRIIRRSSSQVTPGRVHVIGYSLGAQVAGFCGRHYRKVTGRRIGRITGLDPAGPLFDDIDACVSKRDAEFVDIIHTNAGRLMPLPARFGINASVGHVDFYPNGGHDQPGCGLSITGCSHGRAPQLFTESLTNRRCKFTSYRCRGGWKDYLSGLCKRWTRLLQRGEMGYYSIYRRGRKDQYLKTNDRLPLCIRQ